MTVGISFAPGKGLEAIVVTDSRVSLSGRQSDSANKMGEFSSENYHGVIFGSGNGYLIEGAIRNLYDIHSNNLDSYVRAIQSSHKGRGDRADKRLLESEKAKVEQKASLLMPGKQYGIIKQDAQSIPEDKRGHFVQNRMTAAHQKYDQFMDQEMGRVMRMFDDYKRQIPTTFVVVAYDNKKGKIRQFHIDQGGSDELFADHIERGSGFDGANMYFATNLQGVSPATELDPADMLFFALNAYNFSSVNQGVGGMPKVMRVNENGNIPLSNEQVSTLVNLSGAYLSRFDEEKLTHHATRQYIRDVIAEKEGAYESIAKALCLNLEALQGLAVPYSMWQESSNKKLFNGND